MCCGTIQYSYQIESFDPGMGSNLLSGPMLVGSVNQLQVNTSLSGTFTFKIKGVMNGQQALSNTITVTPCSVKLTNTNAAKNLKFYKDSPGTQFFLNPVLCETTICCQQANLMYSS